MKNKSKIKVLALGGAMIGVIAMAGFFLTACDNSADSYTFIVNGNVYKQLEKDSLSNIIDPNIKGYTFEGWYYDKEFKSKVDFDNITTIGSINIYAKMSLIKYTIEYELDGGGFESSPIAEYTVEDSFNLPVPVKKGYKFEGWLESAEKIDKIQAGTTGNKALSATWSLETYTIFYQNTKGAENNNKKTYTVNDSFELNDLSKDGYVFKGFYSNANFTNRIFSITTGETGNKSIYVKWEPITYSVEYDANGGTGTTASSQHTYDVLKNLTQNAFSKTGYKFVGWNTEKDGTGTKYENKEVIANLTKVKDDKITLYAQWEIVEYTIDYQNTKGAENNNKKTYTVNDSFELNDLSKDGYVFEGFYEDQNYTKKIESIPESTTGNKIIYAKMRLITYTINYECDGGGFESSPIAEYTVEDSFNLPVPVKKGYKFEGWLESTEKIDKIQAGTTGDKALSATWVFLPENYDAVGEGTEESPYLIYNSAQFIDAFGNEDNYKKIYNKFFKLANDLTVSRIDKYIRYESATFDGVFDGNDYTITCSNDLGLFPNFILNGTLKNLNLKVENNSWDHYASCNSFLIKEVSFPGEIINCEISSRKAIEINNTIFGVFTLNNYGKLINCRNNVDVYINSNHASLPEGFGGIAYRNFLTGQITDCNNYGNIDRNTSVSVGGIVRFNSGTIKNCTNYGDFSSSSYYGSYGSSGGIVSYLDDGRVEECLNDGNGFFAGICGEVAGGYIQDCLNYGSVKYGGIIKSFATSPSQTTIKGCIYLSNEFINKGIGWIANDSGNYEDYLTEESEIPVAVEQRG